MEYSAKPSTKPFVLVASLPRSATMSLKIGLETLGFGPTLHMSVFTNNRPLTDKWIPALRSPETTNWPEVLDGFGSALDEPQSSVTLNILRGYLAAGRPIKVVLLKRDPVKWWASYSDTIIRYWIPGTLPYVAIKYIAAPIPGAMMLYHCHFLEQIDWSRYHQGYMAEYQAEVRSFINGLNEGNIKVSDSSGEIKDIPTVELLEYNVTEGWDPLCRFLDVDKPNKPFPRVNEGGSFKKGYWDRIYKGTALWTLYIGLGLLGIDIVRNSRSYTGIWSSLRQAISQKL